MKKLLYFFITFALSYHAGAFYEVTFDISQWDEVTRKTVALTGFIVGGFAVMIMLMNEGIENSNKTKD